MIDYIKARQEYQSWLRKGGDEIVWSKKILNTGKHDKKIYMDQDNILYKFLYDRDIDLPQIKNKWLIKYGNTNTVDIEEKDIYFDSEELADNYARKLYRKWKFKQLTGDDLIE